MQHALERMINDIETSSLDSSEDIFTAETEFAIALAEKIEQLEYYKGMVKALADELDDAKKALKQIEENEFPDFLDEHQMHDLTLQDGTKVKLEETVFTYVNKPELEDGLLSLHRIAMDGLIVPIITAKIDISNIDCASKECLFELFEKFSASIAKIPFVYDVEINIEANKNSLSAAARELLEDDIELDSSIFKRSVKRQVKVKRSKIKK